MGGFKEMVTILWFLGVTQTLLCSALAFNHRGGVQSVVLSSTYSPFPYKKKRSQTVVESVYPDLSHLEIVPSTTLKPDLIIVGPGGILQSPVDLPQSVQTETESTPPWQEKLDQLTQLLAAVSGDDLDSFVDNKYDSKIAQEDSRSLEMNVDPSPLPPVTYFLLKQSAANLESEEGRDKRMILGGILAQGIPVLTQFAGSLIKTVLDQLIHRLGSQTYKDDLLGKFVPRALSQTHLKNTQISHSIQQQIKNHNYQSALQTLTSAQRNLKTDNYIPEKFKKVFNGNSNDDELVLATRKIFQGLTETVDGLLTQRLSTVVNLITSLITTLIESLRLKLQNFDAKHSKGEEVLLRITGATLAGIETCLPQDFGGLYSCLGALMALLVLVFPGLLILRNSISNHANKLQNTQISSTIRKMQRNDLFNPHANFPETNDIDRTRSRPHGKLQTKKREESVEEGTDVPDLERLGRSQDHPRAEYSVQFNEATAFLPAPIPIPTLRRKVHNTSNE